MCKFEQFIRERRYLQTSVSERVEWYDESLKWLRVQEPTEADLKVSVMANARSKVEQQPVSQEH